MNNLIYLSDKTNKKEYLKGIAEKVLSITTDIEYILGKDATYRSIPESKIAKVYEATQKLCEEHKIDFQKSRVQAEEYVADTVIRGRFMAFTKHEVEKNEWRQTCWTGSYMALLLLSEMVIE